MSRIVARRHDCCSRSALEVFVSQIFPPSSVVSEDKKQGRSLPLRRDDQF
jgi:hypothetical protein